MPLDFKCRDTRAAAPALARTRFSGIDNGDGLDLDHEIGSGETGDADGCAGRGRHPEIAHPDIGALLELVEVGDKGVGLDDVGPGGARRLETPVQVLERLFHLRPHVTFADAVAVDVAGQLAGGVDDLPLPLTVTTCEYDGFPPDILTFMPSG